jgi:hypothetical protein
MPVIISTMDEIMGRERRDMLFVQFGSPFSTFEERLASNAARKRHLKWFASKGLRYEKTAPRGWLEGDSGIFVVYFDGPADPRVTEYSAIFEDVHGKSLAPEAYRMMILPYDAWLRDPPAPAGDEF